MPPVAFYEPTEIHEACQLLAEDPDGRVALSGGTAVGLMMGQGLLAPEGLVSLAKISELRGIGRQGTWLRIGAGTTLRDVAASGDVAAVAPSLAQACGQVGNPRVRNVATLGGNMAEADYASDPPSALVSLGAVCSVRGTSGAREIAAADFVTYYYENALESGELLVDVWVPLPAADRRAVYLKYRSRSSEDRPCVGVAACADLRDGHVNRLEIVVAGVGPTPQRVPDALAEAEGQTLDAALADRMASRYAESIEPLDDARGSRWYRRRMVAVFVRRSLRRLAEPTTQDAKETRE